jgi:hypothetical protein
MRPRLSGREEERGQLPSRASGKDRRSVRARLESVLRGLWNRLVRRRQDVQIEVASEEARMSPGQRREAEESVEDRQVDEHVEEHLGGIDPDRLLGEAPRRP